MCRLGSKHIYQGMDTLSSATGIHLILICYPIFFFYPYRVIKPLVYFYLEVKCTYLVTKDFCKLFMHSFFPVFDPCDAGADSLAHWQMPLM